VRLRPDAGWQPSLHAIAVPGPDGFDCMVVDDRGEVVLRVEGYQTIALPEPLADDVRAPLAAAMAD
jgi:hypothetical protein